MKHYMGAIAVFAAMLLPAVTRAQTDVAAVGVGASGYDWLVGTWTCTNTLAQSKLGALPSTSLTATKMKDGSIFFHTTSPNGDVTGYYAYAPSTKTWHNPFSDSSGYYGHESSQQSGKTMQFTGMFYMNTGAPVPIRDTYTMLSMDKQYDVSEAQVNGTWKTVAKTTCTKT